MVHLSVGCWEAHFTVSPRVRELEYVAPWLRLLNIQLIRDAFE
jgi:hypothetical protein